MSTTLSDVEVYICLGNGTGGWRCEVHLTVALMWLMLIYIYVDSFTGVDDFDVHLC